LFKALRCCLSIAFLVMMVACFGGEGLGSDNTVSVLIQAEFEKKSISQYGLSQGTYQPARYCWVEGFDPQTNQQFFSGYLNSSGRGVVDVPRGSSFVVKLVARYEVPGSGGGNFRMRGSVKDGPMSPTYSGTDAFNEIPDWSVHSSVYTGNSDFTITIRAMDSTRGREAGAFNIADQAVEFATMMGLLEPGLSLPNLHSFWSFDNKLTDYPLVALDSLYRVMSQATERTIFQHEVMGIGSSWTNGRSDEYNDAALMDSFAHLLFADYSWPATRPDHAFQRIVRRDSEDIAMVEWQTPSEATAAFVNGFCSFMSAAFRKNPQMVDIYHSGPFELYNLGAPTTFYKPNGGEFHRQSVAGALFRIWNNALGGSIEGLRTMWDATYQTGMALNIDSANYPHGYLQCPVGNISSYLSGLANGSQYGVSGSVWNSIRSVLNSESIADPNATWFNQGKLWKRLYSIPAIENDYIRTYPYSYGLYWDYDQAKSYFFSQTFEGSRRITLDMLGGQDLFLELFDDLGIYEQNIGPCPTTLQREIFIGNLPRGNYVVRVRAGNTTQNGNAGFRLRIQ